MSYNPADTGGRTVYGVRLRPLACWDCGFESRSEKECQPLVSVVCCQVEVSAKGRSLVQRNPTEYVCVCVSLNVIKRNNKPIHLE